MSRANSATPLKELLPTVLKILRKSPRPSQKKVQSAWRRLVGDRAARYSWPSALVRGRLVVEVEDSGWMYTLSLRKRELLQGLMELLGGAQVKALSLRIGERKKGAKA